MPETTYHNGNFHVKGHMSADTQTVAANSVTNASIAPNADIEASKLQSHSVTYSVPLTSCRVFDAMQTLLPAAGAADDLGLVGGAIGTASPSLQTSDGAQTTVTQKARVLIPILPQYVSAAALSLSLTAGMLTTVSDGTATIDVSAYLLDKDTTLDAAGDICATAAQSINNLTFAAKSFTITPTNVVAGDMLDVLITIAITDAATGTVVTGCCGAIDLVCNVKA